MSDLAAAEAAESGPQIVIDTDNIILAWYLPGLQNAIMAATEKLRSFLGKKQTGASSRTHCENFHPGTDVQTGMITLSPAWFQQGHNNSQPAPQASVNFKLPAAMSWLEEISESNAILSAILGVIHPRLYKSGQDTFSCLRRAAEIDRQDVLRDWTSVFSGVSVVFNGNVRAHRDGQSRYHWYDLLATMGHYRNSRCVVIAPRFRCITTAVCRVVTVVAVIAAVVAVIVPVVAVVAAVVTVVAAVITVVAAVVVAIVAAVVVSAHHG
ncbi:hypothetical protein EDB84DRAFT_1567921 [Lactarius hengduanensis]|nr:hypothetical protein EDB84DRAFT_1567921 [Lactarius hengduanensis]